MDAPATPEIFLFEGFRLDRRGGGLFRKDDADADAPVAIGSRALDILGVLIARSGEVVSKDEIIAAVWPGTIVEDSNLTVQISALRRVLDRGRTQGSCIQTIPGRGYRFVAVVANPAAETGSASSPVNGVAEHAEEGAAAVAPYRSMRAGDGGPRARFSALRPRPAVLPRSSL
jgi:DNA-binding winged helix-turn-helix (wHTH) protein